MISYYRKRRILYVANSLVVISGGVERRNLDQILYLKKKGLEVDICVLRHIGPMADVYRKHGISVYYFRVYETYEDRRVKFFFLNFFRFYFFLFKKRYHTIVGTQPPSHYMVRCASFPPLGRKVFVMERGNTYHRKKKYFFWDRLFSLWTEKIICVSEATRDGLLETSHISPDKLVLIEEGYKREECLNKPEELARWIQGNFVFGNIGSFIPTKRHEVLIRAFRKVSKNFAKVKLVIIGEGEGSEELYSLVERLGINNKVKFVGEVENTHCYYPLFDVFVFPSVSEGFPGVLVEALLHRLPVICADVRPMSDYITHEKNGILFQPDDVDELADWMEYSIRNTERMSLLGNRGYQTAREKFDYEKQLEKLFNVLTWSYRGQL